MLRPLLTSAEVATVLGVTVRRVRAYADAGELVQVRLSARTIRYPPSAVEELVAARFTGRRRLLPCGTPAAYARHNRERTPACDLCRQAMRREWERRRRSKGVQPRALQPCGTSGAYWRHRRQRTPVCGLCRRARRRKRTQGISVRL
ncbi:helix-turn-helix domain-containing protein [Nocardiopsis sp. CNR-923]|uniref:helix-turn-helix domain-containing protein n=1 Tax=Nocardiopsis sp. CNR-923 TaxID=1904965 RepID=UPI00373FDBA0